MKLLIVSPFFPPHSSVAVVRIASLTRHLLDLGYDITVLTNKLESERKQINNDISLEHIKKIEIDMSSAKGKFLASRDLYIESFHKVMKVSQFDCVLITSGPFYTLPLCEISKKIYNTKCIIDFRDLWILDVRSIKKFLSPGNLLRKIIFYPIERKAIKYADKVVTVTDGWADILKRMYPRDKEKIEIVYNGYDDSYLGVNMHSWPNENGLQIIDKTAIKIMSFGKLSYYSKEYSAVFFRAIKKMQDNHAMIHVVQIGTEEVETNQIIEETGFNRESYLNTGFCDYKEGMGLLSNADICILIDIRKKAIGTKIYDYIYMNKPIIYVGKKNTYLSKFIASFDNGYSCQTEEEIISSLSYIIDENINYLTADDSYKRYNRTNQNWNYLELLKKL